MSVEPEILTTVEGSATERDPGAVSFFSAPGLPLLATVIGLLDSSDDCIKVVSPSGHLELMSCNGMAAMEIDDFESVRGALWASLWPAESAALIEDAVVAGLAGKRSRFEAFCPTAKGDPRWWEVTVTPVPASDGQVVSLLSTSRDITGRVRQKHELESIALEMRHRLRNAFAVSAAIATASARDAPEHAPFARQVAERLNLMANVQAALLDASDRLPLSELVRRALPRDVISGELEIADLPDVTLGGSASKAVGMALGELATNSLKYGAMASGGRVRLSGTHDGNVLTLDWDEVRGEEAGLGAAQVPSSGQGMMIISRMLGAVDGALDSRATATGYVARLTAARLTD